MMPTITLPLPDNIMIISLTACLLICGFCISYYSYYISRRRKKKPEYRPACDINDRISCSKPMESSYGKTGGIDNAIIGILFYTGMLLASWYELLPILRIGAIGSAIISLYFAYRLFFTLRIICILCIAIYVINGLLLWLLW